MSVGRDMMAKLTEVATERFVDNITSITPGALKGGIVTVARHPERDEIVLGSSDGVPKVYRVFRQTNRVIGDDANLIRRLPAMKGRVFSVAVSRDGKRIAAGSSLDGSGEVNVYGYEFDTSLPDNIKKILAKRVAEWNASEQAAVEKYWGDGVELIANTAVPESGIFAVGFHPDGKTLATAGADGVVRLTDAETGSIVKRFEPVPISGKQPAESDMAVAAADDGSEPSSEPRSLQDGTEIVAIEVQPTSIRLTNRFDYVQLLAMGRTDSDSLVDITRMVEIEATQAAVEVSRTGHVRALADGKAELTLRIGSLTAKIPVDVSGVNADYEANYIRDVNPVLTRQGCNQGACHGAAKGKNGFKLSLRGYDALFDVRALTDDLASRRVNVASPDDSLMLLKATGSVPHVGGQLIRPGSPYYETMRNWIAGGVKFDLGTPRVAGIEIQPENPAVQQTGTRQQARVLATYADGRTRDVTREAFIESGDTEVAKADEAGLMTAIRRGEAPILARYEGAYAATTLTVMGDRTGFVWSQWEENQRKNAVQWIALDPRELTATGGTKLAKEEDLSVVATGDNGQVDYTFVAETDLSGITAVRLELLADERLPGNGPGRANNGNLVLTEFEFTAASRDNPQAAKDVKLQKPLADFSQDNYGVNTAIDGKTPDVNNGWAISPNTGVTHWATFQIAKDSRVKEPSVLTFKLVQRFRDKMHSIGRFRISLTTAEHPVGLSLPERFADILATATDKGSEEQQNELMKFFRDRDDELSKRVAAVQESTKPLPADPKLKQLKNELEFAKRPIPEDTQLAALRRDLEQSSKQLEDRRLTAAQDLAWALINSPAFLFNH